MTILYTGNKITVKDAEDMISVSDLDGDGRINFDGASISLLPSASPTIHCPRNFCDTEFVEVHAVRAFPAIHLITDRH